MQKIAEIKNIPYFLPVVYIEIYGALLKKVYYISFICACLARLLPSKPIV